MEGDWPQALRPLTQSRSVGVAWHGRTCVHGRTIMHAAGAKPFSWKACRIEHSACTVFKAARCLPPRLAVRAITLSPRRMHANVSMQKCPPACLCVLAQTTCRREAQCMPCGSSMLFNAPRWRIPACPHHGTSRVAGGAWARVRASRARAPSAARSCPPVPGIKRQADARTHDATTCQVAGSTSSCSSRLRWEVQRPHRNWPMGVCICCSHICMQV